MSEQARGASRRHFDALAIQQGACNPSGIAQMTRLWKDDSISRNMMVETVKARLDEVEAGITAVCSKRSAINMELDDLTKEFTALTREKCLLTAFVEWAQKQKE